MNNRYLILLLLSLLFMTGCNRMVDYGYTTVVYLENASSHDVEIIGVGNRSFELPKKQRIDKGETLRFAASFMGGPPPSPENFIHLPVDIWFDGQVVVTHHPNREIDHNICSEDSYEVLYQEEFVGEYKFTFTDADYEYALEFGYVVLP